MSTAVRQVQHFRKYQKADTPSWLPLIAVGILAGFDVWIVSYLVMAIIRMAQ